MDDDPATSFPVVDAEPANPGHDGGDAVGPVAGRNMGTEVDEHVPLRIALPVPGAAPPEGDLDLDDRLEPVDVGTFKQAGLDQSHGPGRIASRHGPDRAS